MHDILLIELIADNNSPEFVLPLSDDKYPKVHKSYITKRKYAHLFIWSQQNNKTESSFLIRLVDLLGMLINDPSK